MEWGSLQIVMYNCSKLAGRHPPKPRHMICRAQVAYVRQGHFSNLWEGSRRRRLASGFLFPFVYLFISDKVSVIAQASLEPYRTVLEWGFSTSPQLQISQPVEQS